MRQLSLVVVLAALAGCTTGNRIDPDGGAQPTPDSGPDGGTTPVPDSGPVPDGGPRLDDVLIYAHSRDTLYTFSAYTNTVTEIGDFRTASGDDAPPVLDLAVDSAGVVFISTDDSRDSEAMLFRVDPLTAVVTPVGEIVLDDPNERLFALSFLAPSESPDGTEVLVGATNGVAGEGAAVYAVDRTDASAEFLGFYPDGWFSSGDIVSVDGLGTYATLRSTDASFPGDVLARILFSASGATSVIVIGPVKSATEDFRQIFGLGYWGRNLFGFSNSGQLIRINRETGAGTVVSTATGADSFWGAGVTVDVPFLF